MGGSCVPYAETCHSIPPEHDCGTLTLCECSVEWLCEDYGGLGCYHRGDGSPYCCSGDSDTCASAGGG